MRKFLNKFRKDESGAVTIEWVVLAAAVTSMSMIIAVTIQPEISGIAGRIATALSNVTVGGF